MPKVKLGDVAIESRETYKGDKRGLPIVGLEHITPEEVTLSNWATDTENTFTKMFHKGDMLFGRRRAYLKKAAQAPFDGICSGDITVIRAKADKLLPDLLPFIIQNDDLFDFAVGKSAGSLSPRVKWENLKNYAFELLPLDEQKKLAEVLWSINDTIQAYQKLLAETDELVKSQFIEMFGDGEFPICKLADECKIITKGTTPTTLGFNFTDSGVNFVKIENISSEGHFIMDKMMYIDEKCNEAMKRSQLENGDILFSIAGAIGRCAIVSDEILPANINQALAIVRLKRNSKLSRGFLLAALKSGYVERQYMILKRGAAQLNLSLKDVGNFSIPIPPAAKQDEYVRIAAQSDKSKFSLQSAITSLQATKRSIIDEAFGIRRKE